MTDQTTTADLPAMARDVINQIRYVVLGTIDEDGRTRTSPVYFVPRGYQDLYWVSDPASHHSHNLARDDRLSGVIFDSTVAPGPDARAVYLTAPLGKSSMTSLRNTSHMPATQIAVAGPSPRRN